MLEKILRLYTMAMVGDVRSPLPHLFGPPGCGKSSSVEQAAEIIGCKLHIINVSRISPLELEGVQMPMPHADDGLHLRLLTATFWTQLKEGDILLLDEFLRGFPEVYNGLLDILTSRQVGGFKIPRVFIIAASNSTVAYDQALEDRLLHIPVPDPRKKKRYANEIAQRLVDEIGLLPSVVNHMDMTRLLDEVVLPTYNVLDQLGLRGAPAVSVTNEFRSIRNLIGQARLREVQTEQLTSLILASNAEAMRSQKYQYVMLLTGEHVDARYTSAARKLKGSSKLTPVQALNLDLNLQLIELEESKEYPKGATVA